jgi:hypothetical protein
MRTADERPFFCHSERSRGIVAERQGTGSARAKACLNREDAGESPSGDSGLRLTRVDPSAALGVTEKNGERERGK